MLGVSSWGMQPEPLLAVGTHGWVWPRLEGACPSVEVGRAAGLLDKDGERRPLQVGGEEGANCSHVLGGWDAAALAPRGQIGVRPMWQEAVQEAG